jgi:hypothetical protein
MTAPNRQAVTGVTVNNGASTFTIAGDQTSWIKAGYELWDTGLSKFQFIDSDTVSANYSGGATTVTLSAAWGGTTITNGSAIIKIISQGTSWLGSVVTLIRALINGVLSAIANLTASNDDVLQWKAGAPTNRTMAQLAADLHYAMTPQVITVTGASGAQTVSLAGVFPGVPTAVVFSAMTGNVSDVTFTGATTGQQVIVEVRDASHTVTITQAASVLGGGVSWVGGDYDTISLIKLSYWTELCRSVNS